MASEKAWTAQARLCGSRVRSARVAAGLSQERLAERAGLHRTYIGHVERGEVNPTLFNLIRISAALAIDPADLVKDLRP